MTSPRPGPSPPTGRPAERARGWLDLARHLARSGSREPAAVAARTCQSLAERVGDADLAGVARALVGELTGTVLTPLHVGVGGDDAVDPDEARAAWFGSPADRVVAMLGWVERDGALDVVRVVVPGTPRGRRAWGSLAASLPREVPVTLRLPARDRAIVRSARRLGFTPHSTTRRSAGDATDRDRTDRRLRYVGGTVTLSRDPGAP